MINLKSALEVATCTHPGMVRSHNEDSIAADPEAGLAVLADDMGGYNAGEVASGIAVEYIRTEMKKQLVGKKPEELEEHYRNRSLLKLDVLPEDVAEAAFFLASDMAAKSTGNIINVDAGNAQSFTR